MDPDFYPSGISDPGSNNNNNRGASFSVLFFCQLLKNQSTFYQKIVTKLSKIWGSGKPITDPGFRIQGSSNTFSLRPMLQITPVWATGSWTGTRRTPTCWTLPWRRRTTRTRRSCCAWRWPTRGTSWTSSRTGPAFCRFLELCFVTNLSHFFSQ